METLNLGIDGLDEIEQIGHGGSSRVYRATQRDLDRTVALKVLTRSDDPEVGRRFDRERKAMGRLSLNEGIVPVYSTGVTEQGEPYLLMPYYPNGSLQDRLEDGPVPWRDAVRYVASAAATMADAHQMGVVHLDLKPANILLSTNGEPRIADFGIARLVSEQAHTTNSNAAFTPTFTAPETLLGEEATATADVYGLAATLWALIAGRPPFRATGGEDNTLMAIVGRVVHQPIGDLRDLAPDPICRVIETATAKDPASRYPTAGALGLALHEAIDEVERADWPAPSMPAAGPTGGDGTTAPMALSAAATVPASAPPAAETVSTSAEPAVGPNLADDAPPMAATAAMGATGEPSGLRFERPVPPRLVPAASDRTAFAADLLDRYGSIVAGLMVVALVAVGLLFVRQYVQGDESVAGTELTTPSSVPTTVSSGALAGAGRSQTAPTEPLAPVTSIEVTTTPTTQAPTSAATSPTSVPTSDTSDTTDPDSTDTTDPDTTDTTDPDTTDTTDPDTTDTTDPDTTDTTDPDSTDTTDPDTTDTTDPDTTDTTEPVPPAQLAPPTALVAGSVSAEAVVLSWAPPAVTTGLTGYRIFRAEADGLVFRRIGSVGPDVVAFTDTTVEEGEVYLYQVQAIGAPGGDPPANSVRSTPLAVTVPDNASPPDPDDLDPEGGPTQPQTSTP